MQQGNSVGPAIFGMAIHEAVEKATRRVRQDLGAKALEVIQFYLDDGAVTVEAKAVA